MAQVANAAAFLASDHAEAMTTTITHLTTDAVIDWPLFGIVRFGRHAVSGDE